MSLSQQQTWRVLQRIASLKFAELRKEHPDWHMEDLFAALQLPQTALLLDLAEKAGFSPRSQPTPEEILVVAKALLWCGVWSAEAIAQRTGIHISRVSAVMEMRQYGFGVAPYGTAPYGGNRKNSDGKTAVPRRVTMAGQMSYRGHTYTLGASYRGKNAMILDRGEQLVAMFPDQSPLILTRRR